MNVIRLWCLETSPPGIKVVDIDCGWVLVGCLFWRCINRQCSVYYVVIMSMLKSADLEGVVWVGAGVADGLGVLEEDGGGGSAELVTTVEAGDLEDEQVAHDLALELGDEVSGSLGGATCWGVLASESLRGDVDARWVRESAYQWQ